MIPEEQLAEIREAIESAARPLIFFDDDQDGLCSFLQFYRANPESKGVIVKTSGDMDEGFLRKVDEYQPDKVFILDIHSVSQEFLDKSGETYWIDHHTPVERKHVHYYNPHLHDEEDNRPISYWTYKAVKKSLWIAMVGCVGDWFLPKDLKEEFSKQYPELLPITTDRAEDALFATELGTLARAFSFVIKGHLKSAKKAYKVLTRVKEPHEILQQSSKEGKYIWKQFQKVNKHYEDLKAAVKVTDDPLIVYIYKDAKMSLTSDLSNEILYENPDKLIIICREKNGEMKCSLRSKKYEVLPVLQKALEEVDGVGGGHVYACGANIQKRDFDRFIDLLREQLKQ